MKAFHSSVCILGGGPAALLSQIFLRQRGIDSTVVAGSVLGGLATMQFGGVRLSPIPIFVSPASDLYRRLAWAPPADADFVTVSNSPVKSNGHVDEIHAGSYAEFMVQRYPDAQQRLIITKKHLGETAFQRNFAGLCRKVLSHHPPGHRFADRIGFCEGVSLFLHYLEREGFPDPLRGPIRAIDVDRKCVVTESHQITYDRLISTVPLLDFLALAGMPTSLQVSGAGARFAVVRTRGEVTPNRLIYDCDAASPVHRVFTPLAHYAIVQVAQPAWDSDDAPIARRTGELLDLDEEPEILRRLAVENCYPLAVSDYGLRDAIVSDLQQRNVTLFGRFAEWEYRDIEELNWERIGCLS